MQPDICIWIITLLSIFCIIIRPFGLAEVYWAVGGALLMIILRLISPSDAYNAMLKGLNVYLFLTGMMLLAEVAREAKLFDWLATIAITFSKGSGKRLFLLLYAVGTVTTVFLSNDATVVVLTPAVITATKVAKIKNALPYLFICVFIANAASFVLPISNPANLVVYSDHLPALASWLRQYSIPSIISIAITYGALYYTQRHTLKGGIPSGITIPKRSGAGKLAGTGILCAAVTLTVCSAFDIALGLPAAISGLTIFVLATWYGKLPRIKIVRQLSWSVLPLVAGLFVMVEGLSKTAMLTAAGNVLEHGSLQSRTAAIWGSGIGIALFGNIINNLPAGLIAGKTLQSANVPEIIQRSVLIGLDLGPNLSVTGSLATILWLMVLRKEGISVSAWEFFKTGIMVMITALIAAIACLWI